MYPKIWKMAFRMVTLVTLEIWEERCENDDKMKLEDKVLRDHIVSIK